MLAQQHDVVRPDAARTLTLELQLIGHVLQHSPTTTYMCTAIGIELIASAFLFRGESIEQTPDHRTGLAHAGARHLPSTRQQTHGSAGAHHVFVAQL